MSEQRFKQILKSHEVRYFTGVPVLVNNFALLKNNKAGKMSAQICLQSISEETIRTLYIDVLCKDGRGTKIPGVSGFKYSSLSAIRDQKFGQSIPVHLPDSATQSIEIQIVKVVFAAGSVIESTAYTAGCAVPLRQKLSDYFKGGNLVDHFIRQANRTAKYVPIWQDEIWRCTCGSINHTYEQRCHNCMLALAKQKELLESVASMPDQGVRKRVQINWAQKHAEAQKRQKEEVQKAEAKRKRLRTIFLPIADVLIILIIVFITVVTPTGKYANAVALKQAGNFDQAIAAFEALGDYKDSPQQIEQIDAQITAMQYNDAIALLSAGELDSAIAAFNALGSYKDSQQQISEAYYLKAASFILQGDYASSEISIKQAQKYTAADLPNSDPAETEPAIDAAKVPGGSFLASDKEQILSAYYKRGKQLLNDGNYRQAWVAFYRSGDYASSIDKDSSFVYIIDGMDSHADIVSSGYTSTAGLRADGTVVAIGGNSRNQCDVQDWSSITAVSSGGSFTVGLRADGTVVAIGNNSFSQCNTQNWRDIIAVSAGYGHTLGLKANGRVVAVGSNSTLFAAGSEHNSNLAGQSDVQDWRDITAVSAGYSHSTGLKADGTLVVVGNNMYGQCDVQDWSDISAVSSGNYHTVGLKSNGTAIAVGKNTWEACDVQGWQYIVAISAGGHHTVGLRADGTVVAVGNNEYGQCNVQDWRDIVAISAGYTYTVGLKADGTLVAVGNNEHGHGNVQNWDLL